MPAERAGSSPGGQGKAIPVEETAVQLSLAIATAENPQGATRRKTRGRLGAIRAGAPKAIGNAGSAVPATMEEVAERLTDALLKVASNKGAPGPDGQTIEALLEQWPVVAPRLQADLLSGVYQPGVHSQGRGRAGRTRDSRRDRPGGPRGCAAGARTAVGADVSPLKSRVSTRPKLPYGYHRGQGASRGRLRVVRGS